MIVLGYFVVGLGGLVLFWLTNKLSALNCNISAAKSSGLPYRISSKFPLFYFLVPS